MFEGKRYTTIVHMQSITNCITGHKTEFPPKYGVYDNKTETDVVIIGFKPNCYEDIKKKAMEMNGDI